MARRTKVYTVTDEGRDKGKTFLITEMSALQAEQWALRAFMAAAASNTTIPDEQLSGGIAVLALDPLSLLLKMPYDLAKPLLAEMLDCVQYIPTPSKPEVVRKLLMQEGAEDIEEMGTLTKLRLEVLNLHVDFSQDGAA